MFRFGIYDAVASVVLLKMFHLKGIYQVTYEAPCAKCEFKQMYAEI